MVASTFRSIGMLLLVIMAEQIGCLFKYTGWLFVLDIVMTSEIENRQKNMWIQTNKWGNQNRVSLEKDKMSLKREKNILLATKYSRKFTTLLLLIIYGYMRIVFNSIISHYIAPFFRTDFNFAHFVENFIHRVFFICVPYVTRCKKSLSVT